MEINSFFDTLHAELKEKFNLQEEDLVKLRHAFTLAAANEYIKKYMTSVLAAQQPQSRSTLTWTAPKAALIELLYALHYAKVIDEGTADVKAIATVLEQAFNINLGGNYYRVLQDIRLRKGNPTVFMDLLRQKLQQQINRLNDE